MFGWLVVNGFLKKEKFAEIYEWLMAAGEKDGLELLLFENTELLLIGNHFLNPAAEKRMPDFVLFWDKDVRLARRLEEMGLLVLNSSESIAVCDDKSATYLTLKNYGIAMPETIVGPFTYENIGYTEYGYLNAVAERLGLPFVIKECFGSFGWQVYLAHSLVEAMEILKKVAGKPVLFQKYIAESAGRDVRLQIVGNQVAASMYRYSDMDFRANISSGGKMKSYEPTEAETELALRVTKLLGLDFAGVDILLGEEGPLLCEVNSNAHFRNIFDCTGVNTAEYIMEWIAKRVSERRK